MKILLLLLIYIPILVTSCKKSTPVTPESSISADVDGIKETFNTNATAVASVSNLLGTGNVHILIISGKETSDSGSDIINVIVTSASAITKGTYPVMTGVPPAYSATSVSFIQGYETFFPTQNVTLQNLITITSISSTNVQGTFEVALSGAVASTSPVYTNKIITNGSFNVSIKPAN